MKKLAIVIALLSIASPLIGQTTFGGTGTGVYWFGAYGSGSIAGHPYRSNPYQSQRVTVGVQGTRLDLQMYCSGSCTSVTATVDNGTATTVPITSNSGWAWYTIFTGLTDTTHVVSVTNGQHAVDNNNFARVYGSAPALVVPPNYGQLMTILDQTRGASPFVGVGQLDPYHVLTTNWATPVPQWMNGDMGIRFNATAGTTNIQTWGPDTQGIALLEDGKIVGTQKGGTCNGSFTLFNFPANPPDGNQHTFEIVIGESTEPSSPASHPECTGSNGYLNQMYQVMIGGGTIGTATPPRPCYFQFYGDSLTSIDSWDNALSGLHTVSWEVGRALGCATERYGVDGRTVANSTDNQWMMRNVSGAQAVTIAPNIFEVNGGFNDVRAATPIATFTTDYQQMLSNIAAQLVTQTPCNTQSCTILASGTYPCNATGTTNCGLRPQYLTAQQNAVAAYMASDPNSPTNGGHIPVYFFDTTGWYWSSTTSGDINHHDYIHPTDQGFDRVSVKEVPIWCSHLPGCVPYTVSGPSTGTVGDTSTPFTLQLMATPNDPYHNHAIFTANYSTSDISTTPYDSITLSDSGKGGTFRSSSVCGSTTFTAGNPVTIAPTAGDNCLSFTYTPANSGSIAIKVSNHQNLPSGNQWQDVAPLSFQVNPGFALTVNEVGSGTVTSSDGNLNCGSVCSYNYANGSVVNLTATASSGWAFTQWQGCDSVSGNVCTVTVTSSRSATASFGTAQSITFPNPGSQIYGVAPITLGATASSGLPVSYTVLSGPASVSGKVLTVTGAGTVTVQANQAGNTNYAPAPPVQQTFTVGKAVLTVTANNASMTYGGALPSFTTSYSGFVNGDTAAVLSGVPSLSTTASSASPTGSYAITAAQGTLAASNYSFSFVNGSLTIGKAVLTVTANNASMTYGGAVPAFTASYSGFVNDDTAAVLSGVPSLTSPATSGSPVGSYPISAAQGTLAASNYSLGFVNGALAIQMAGSSVAVNSALGSLQASQSTTLTATVTVSGLGGAPSGSVSFMLGATLLGTGTLSGVDATDATATMQLNGSQLVAGANSITAVYSGDTNYTASTSPAITVTLATGPVSFGGVAVGTAAAVQTLTYSFTATETLASVNILTEGVANLDYTDGGSTTCQAGTTYTAGQSCTVSVGFKPTAPGARAGAVVLFAQGSTVPLFTGYVSGTGRSGAVALDRGTQTSAGMIAGGMTQGSAIDAVGNLYVTDSNNGQVVKIAAGTLVQSVVLNGLSNPVAVALDGGGNLYVAENSGVLLVPNENGTLNTADQSMVSLAGVGAAAGVALDAAGNLYVSDATHGTVVEAPSGGGGLQSIATGLANPRGIAVDTAGNVYVTSDGGVTEYPAGGGSGTAVGSGYVKASSVAVDAAGTVYVADTTAGQIVQVPTTGAQSVFAVSGITAPAGVTVDAAANVYVSDTNNLYAVNRTQAGAFDFGSVNVGSSSAAQTLTVTNVGNGQLTLTNLAVTGGFSQQPSGGTDCTGSTQLAKGTSCAIAIVFTPTGNGGASGTVTLTDNALNNTSSTQSATLSGIGVTSQQNQTITFPNPGSQTYGVAPLTLTATATSGLPVTYAVVSGPATISGNVLTVTGAGTITIQADQGGNANYSAAPSVQQNLTVGKAVLTVTANNASMTYGGALPSFTTSYSGFVNGDTAAVLSGVPSLSTTASSASPTGSYAITAAQGTLAASNYSFSFVNGSLTIGKAVLTVTANNASMTYGGAVPAFTASYSGFVNGDTAAVLSGVPSLTSPATSGSPVGSYPISAAQGTLAASNYSFSFVNGALAIQMAGSSVAVNSALGSLQASQSTTLTATVTVSGLGGAPSGSVSFMLGATLLGTGTLSVVDATDATATMQLNGSQLVAGANSITAVYSGDTNYTASTSPAITVTLATGPVSFGGVSVGTAAAVQTLTYSFTATETLASVNILTEGVANLDYTDGGNTTCQAGTTYTAGQSCTVSVGFKPTAPGARAGAVVLFAQGSTVPLFTGYVSGTGRSGAVALDRGTQTSAGMIAGGMTQGSAIDAVGNLYVTDSNNGQVVKIAAGTLVQSVVLNGLSNPVAVALDGGGNLYVAENSGVLLVPNENGTLNTADQSMVSLAGVGAAAGVALDAAGNLYVSDATHGTVVEAPSGGGGLQSIATGLANPRGIAVDTAGNVYVTSDGGVTEYPAGGGSGTAVGSGYVKASSVAVDAAGTVYVADTTAGQIVQVPTTGAQSVFAVSGITAPAGVTVDAAANVYVSDTNNLYAVNRTQAGAFDFGSVNVGSSSAAQTLTVTNVGNGQLTLTNLAVTGGFSQQPSGGTDCTGSTQLAKGTSCAIAIVFTPTGNGGASGTVTLTDNALNNTSSTQSATLSGIGVTSQQNQTITFPSQTVITLNATASSGLPITYTVISGPGTISGNVLTINGPGTVTVEADQAGNASYSPAPPVHLTFTASAPF